MFLGSLNIYRKTKIRLFLSSNLLNYFFAGAYFSCGTFAKDQIMDFCRRFRHRTAVIDNRLYIDGGYINWNPLSQNPLNYTS